MTIENYSLYNSNKYLHPVFTSEKVEAGILTKPIETIQKTIETGVDTFVGQENDQKKKKTRTRAIIASSTVLVLGALTFGLNPTSSGKILSKLKNLQASLDLKIQRSKQDFLKSNMFKFFKKVSNKTEQGMHIYFNANSGKDIIFKDMCVNNNKKYPEFLTKNETVHKIVKTLDDGFVKVFKKPHEKITEIFDKISRSTVKKNYSSASKRMDALEAFIKSYKEKLPADKQALVDKKLIDISKAREAFSDDKVLERLKNQEKLMGNLEKDIWNKIYNKKDGFAKNSTSFWAQEALTAQKTQVEKEGKEIVSKVIGSKNEKGLYDDVISLFKDNLEPDEMKRLKTGLKDVTKKLKKAKHSECFEYFDKKRDLVLGGAPTDIVTAVTGMGLCGVAVSRAEKEKRWSTAFNTGVPVLVGLGSSLAFSAMLYSGGVGLILGAVVGGITQIACGLITKHVLGHKDEEESAVTENNTKKQAQELNKQSEQKEVKNA